MNDIIIWGLLFLAAVLLLVFRSISDRKKIKRQLLRQLREEYGKAPMKNRLREEAAVKGSYLHDIRNFGGKRGSLLTSGGQWAAAMDEAHDRKKRQGFFLDDITWNDLDMELIFQRINYTRSSAGAEELYRMLRCPVMDSGVLKERNALADGLGEWTALREDLSLELYAIGFTGKYSLEDYLDYLENVGQRNNLKHILLDCLYLPAAGMLFVNVGVGMACLFLVLAANIMTYFKEKGEVNPYLVSFAYILRMLRGAGNICDILEKAERSGGLRAGHDVDDVMSGKVRDAEEQLRYHAAECLRKYREILRKTSAELEGFRRFSGVAMSMGNPVGGSGPLDILLDYLRMAFHLDLMKFNQMLKVVREKQETVEEMVLAIGTLDACISIAYYRASLDGWCRPELYRDEDKASNAYASGEIDSRLADKSSDGIFDGAWDGKVIAEEGSGIRNQRDFGIQTEGLYHPLIERPVKNSIRADRGVLITGSNASGKSTFLKTVALGAVFSQTICTVLAEHWSAPFYRVMSSMALRDNLTGGESYFMVELKALKRILDACGENPCGGDAVWDRQGERAYKDTESGSGTDRQICGAYPVLCFVDEVLRGTNTVERIAASSRILKSLTGKQVLCFAATHDIELTYLLEKEYDNYHFEENIDNGDISFNYLLKKGRAESRNAIQLLKVMGYDERVTEEAERLAEHFLESGEWVEGQAKNLRDKQKELTAEIITALSNAVEAKDRYTNGHSGRVAKYVREIAARMGFSKEEQERVYYAGLLHDVGKIGVADTIINKAGALTEEEFSKMKLHTMQGYYILKEISSAGDFAIGARWHHERYDGKGYPNGLSGENIPLIARMIGVADAYDAMTSNRSYRRMMPQAAAREEIRKGIGTQFDPEIAAIMLEMIDEDTGYQMRQPDDAAEHIILAIDDDPMVHRLLKFVLQTEPSYQLETVFSGEEGIAFLQSQPADLVLLDVEMPGISGMDVLAWIRENKQSVPVIFLTGDKNIDMIQKAEQLGISDYLTKPLLADVLMKSIQNVLFHYRVQ